MNQTKTSTPRERLARLLSLLRRTRMYWRSALAIVLVGTMIALVVALRSKRAWRSETTVLYRESIQTGKDGDGAARRAAQLGPKLKDMVNARPRLASVIQEYGLYPEKSARSMVEAVEEMQSNLGFRARNSDTFVISFVYDDPVVTHKVVARLAELMIADYNRENLDAATMTRDFLEREVNQAEKDVDDASRALATFLAQHPQFQWGINDSPYAPTPGAPGAPGVAAQPVPAMRAPLPPPPSDPQLAALEGRLAGVEAKLAPPAAPGAPNTGAPSTIADAQKRRDAAAADLATAQAALAEKLQTLTPAHPDASLAKTRVEAAQQNLAAAENALRAAKAGTPPADSARTNDSLPPEQKAQLERERASLRQKIGERRSELGLADPRAATQAKRGGTQDIVELETEWHRLRLELERARDHVRMVQANERTAGLSADAAEKKSQSEMAILEPAYLPTRPDRGRGRVFFAGFAMALFFGIAYASTRVLMNDVLYDDADVEALGGPPMLVSMPRLPRASSRDDTRSIVAITNRRHDDVARDLDAPPRRKSPPRRAPDAAPRGRKFAQTLVFNGACAAEATIEVDGAPSSRRGASTVRFGSPVFIEPASPLRDAIPLHPASFRPARDSNGAPHRDDADGNGHGRGGANGDPAHADSGHDAALVLYPRYGLVAAAADEPEFEILGADVDAGEGVLGLLRAGPPGALAALRVLRHRLDQHRGDGHLVVSVVSASADEGKTTLAVRLALTLSEAERARVVLVDGNLERPRVASALGIRLAEELGLSAQIRRRMGGRPRPWGLVRLTPSLSLLAEPGPEATFPAALHSTHFDVALRTLRRHHDYVVIDGPAVLGSGDANVIEDASDAVVVVARAGRTKGSELSRAADQLGERRIVGVVLNDLGSSKRR